MKKLDEIIFKYFAEETDKEQFKSTLLSEILKVVDSMPVSLIDISFDGVEQCYEQAIVIKDLKSKLTDFFK